MLAKIRSKVRKILVNRGLLKFISPRSKLAHKYIDGIGIEIGALHQPLDVPKSATVKYVDVVTKEKNIKNFPELDISKMVDVDFVTDGFKLEGIEQRKYNFVIANHVLEHSPNPIRTLQVWFSVLKHEGILYFSVPELNHCFDKGRKITQLTHFKDDFTFYEKMSENQIGDHNRPHYIEWVQISAPNILGKKYSEIEAQREIEKLNVSQAEIHFHTFTKKSLWELLGELKKEILPELEILEIVESFAGEIICVCQKRRGSESH